METIPWCGCLEVFATEDFVWNAQSQGPKAHSVAGRVSARLKSCPDTKPSSCQDPKQSWFESGAQVFETHESSSYAK